MLALRSRRAPHRVLPGEGVTSRNRPFEGTRWIRSPRIHESAARDPKTPLQKKTDDQWAKVVVALCQGVTKPVAPRYGRKRALTMGTRPTFVSLADDTRLGREVEYRTARPQPTSGGAHPI